MKWKIGNIEIKNQIVLAPMAGISNPSYMKICEEMGVGYAVTELISAEAIARNNKKTLEMLNGIDTLNIPVAVQIFGSNPETMAKASRILVDLHQIRLIDINMGCPVPKVALKNQAGSALLKDPLKVKEIVSEVVQHVKIPVTVKIRSGWDENNINAVQIAKVIEEAGAKAICVHARTRSQGYSGHADWKVIREVKKSVSIPVIGNGDVTSPELAQKMLFETGCDAVMIGRGLLGNPWLVKACLDYLESGHYSTISSLEKVDMMKKHFEMLKNDKNEQVALLEIRTNLLYYLKGMPKNKEIKQLVCQTKTETDLQRVLEDYFIYLKENNL